MATMEYAKGTKAVWHSPRGYNKPGEVVTVNDQCGQQYQIISEADIGEDGPSYYWVHESELGPVMDKHQKQAFHHVAMAHALGTSTAEQRKHSHVDEVGHGGVQPWSAGPLFPCIIGRVERYREQSPAEVLDPLRDRLECTWYVLIAYGREEEYATREDAEQVARWLNRDPEGRKRWAARGALVASVNSGREVVGDFHGMPVYADEVQS
jgi:hypothetical protein